MFKQLDPLNTEYHLPGKHACLVASTGVSYSTVKSNGTWINVVSGVEPNPLSPQLSKVKLGDELLTLDGVNQGIRLIDVSLSEGYAMRRPDLKSISRVNGKTSRLPVRDASTYEFKSRGGGVYTVVLPWIAEVNDECVEQATAVTDALASRRPLLPINAAATTASRAQNKAASADRWFHPSSNRNLKWTIYAPETHNMGIIRLDTFGDSPSSAANITAAIRDLLLNQLANTKSVVFDVRSNSGGPLGFAAETIPQLFSSSYIRTGSGSVLRRTINQRILENAGHGELEKWAIAYKNRSNVKWTEEIDANRIGQVYTNPVGLLTGRDCYGPCEVFAATIKSNMVGPIFGEDYVTGGAMTNMVDYNSFLAPASPKDFPVLPYSKHMPLAAPNFKVAWQDYNPLPDSQDSVSLGFGVYSDFVVAPTLEDITNTDQLSSPFERVAQILAEVFAGHPISSLPPSRVFPNDAEECVACQVLPKDTIISPCGHYCLCSSCCSMLGQCPMCRGEISSVMPACRLK